MLITTPASPSPAPSYTYSVQFNDDVALADGPINHSFLDGYLNISSENFKSASVVIEVRASASVYDVSAEYTYNLELYYCCLDGFTSFNVNPSSSPVYLYDGSTLEFEASSSHTRENCIVQYTCFYDAALSPDFCSFFDAAQGRWSFSTTDKTTYPPGSYKISIRFGFQENEDPDFIPPEMSYDLTLSNLCSPETITVPEATEMLFYAYNGDEDTLSFTAAF